MIRCKRCYGTGHLETKVEGSNEPFFANCPDCYGAGQVEEPAPSAPADERCMLNFRNPCDLTCHACPYTTHTEGEIS